MAKVIVSFDEAEFNYIKNKVEERERFKRKWSRISPSETERVTGFQAEYAVKVYLGEEALLDENHYKGGAGNVDIWFRDKGFSVRSTENKENNLLVREGETEGVDGFILTISKPRVVWLVGWIDTESYLKQAEVRDPQNLGKPCWILKKQNLWSVETIFQYIL